MKKIICVFFVSLCLVITKGFSQSSTINIISYDIKANYDFNKRIIDFTANVNLENSMNSGSVKLLLSSYSSLKSTKAENTELKTSRISNEDDTLFIIIPESLKNKKLLNICFVYSLPIDTFIINNVIPLRRENRWYPLQYNDITSMKLDITAPNNYLVLPTGDLKRVAIKKDNSEYNYEMANCGSYALIVASKDIMRITVKKMNDVNVNFYFAKQKDTVLNRKMIKIDESFMNDVYKSFSFYNKYIELYKHKDLNVFEIPDTSGGLGQSLSTLIVFTTPMLYNYSYGYNWPAHEVGHQWWGDELHIKSGVKGRWFLEESITEYFKAMFIQNSMGDDSLKKQLKFYQASYNAIDKSKELPIIEINDVNTDETADVIYSKGPLVVNKLRNLMGNENYQKFIQELYKTYYGKFLIYDDFIKILSKYDTKGNLVSSLNKWLSEKGFEE